MSPAEFAARPNSRDRAVMLIAHIGRGKCGSSSLQNALYTQRLQLLDQGIYVPETVHAGNNHELWKDLTTDAQPPLALSSLADSLRNPAYTSTVVSSEYFLDLDERSVRKLLDVIPDGEIRAIIYLRDYAGWFPSLYSQKTKKGRLKQDFDWYFEREFKRKVSIIPQVRVWVSCIGTKNLVIRQMKDELIDGRSIAWDMGSQIGANVAETERRNVSPHWWAVEFRRAMATLVTSPDAGTEQAINFAMNEFNLRAHNERIGSAPYLTEEQSARLRALYRSDIEALYDLLGQPAGAQFSRSMAPRAASEPPPSLAIVPRHHVVAVAAMCAERFGPDSAIIRAMHTFLDEACQSRV